MIESPTQASIEEAARLLKHGELVAFPTETVYGLGAHALDTAAVESIFSVKGRPPTNPLIVHIASTDDITRFARLDALNALQRTQLEKLLEFWPGPLSIVLPKQECVPDIVTAGLPSVALRIPSHPVAIRLLECAGIPLAAPSANPYMYVSPTTAEHVQHQIGHKIPLILNGGPCAVGLESTVVSLVHEKPTLLRHGAITKEQLEHALGPITCQDISVSSETAVQSPGQHKKHYAPHTPVYGIEHLSSFSSLNSVGFIGFEKQRDEAARFPFSVVSYLSATDDLEEAARHLFTMMRSYDESNLDAIVIGKCSANGIGAALQDRVQRALTDTLP